VVKYFQFVADTVNGEIREFPQTFELKCDKVFPLGVDIVRDFDDNGCIIARKVFCIRHGTDIFGTMSIQSLQGWINYLNAVCPCCPKICYLIINGCYAQVNGCNLLYY
jgi:hypothetical protein